MRLSVFGPVRQSPSVVLNPCKLGWIWDARSVLQSDPALSPSDSADSLKRPDTSPADFDGAPHPLIKEIIKYVVKKKFTALRSNQFVELNPF